MKRIEPGMLCLVIGLRKRPYLNGKSVKVERWVSNGDVIDRSGLTYRDVGGWLCTGDIESVSGFKGYSIFHAKNLMPISGGDNLEDLDTEKDLGVTA